MQRRILACLVVGLVLAPTVVPAQGGKKAEAKAAKGAAKAEPKKQDESRLGAALAGLTPRSLGPALTSGRIADLAVDPAQPKTYYVAVASGGVWKTTNAGTTWTSVFDKQGSYSVGTVVLDPKNPLVVWVGSGENNSQRSVGYGDGVYRSFDGGRTWENLGLKDSEHIGKIVIDPRDSKVVYVAAQGPLWRDGGDRGLYKTTDAGKTWKKILEVSDKTGVSDLIYDPRDPDTLYAAAYQRRRHVWTLINGGPESALYKSTDGGASWRKITAGLPSGDTGRIGLAISPINPDIVYATVEAQGETGGFFRSTNRGESWEKRSGYVSSSPQYYQELFPDPNVLDRVYQVDVFLQVSDDGGKTWRNAGERFKHVDNHVVWIDPEDSDHLLVGCDGGIYETWDRAQTWDYKANLPITQFYRISTDNASPVYGVYGGTQDNFSLGGPSRTFSGNGIDNLDWYVTQGGDGFETQVDPTDENIVYAQLQYGVLSRFDKRNGEGLDIQPQPTEPGEALRWNWDSPLLISPHSHKRLYFGANKLFRSDDRGDTWRAISPDLTRQLDRNKLEVMGQVWSVDAVAKNASTSFYGNTISLTESTRVEGLLYVGTDDGLVQVSEDAGGAWRKIETFPGVPERTYVADLESSRHDANLVYAAFNNHKMGDFKPYLLKSADRGKTWTSIVGDLPERGSVWTVVEDPVRPELLFAGTEFGAFATFDGGKRWHKLAGLPTIAVRDLEIHQREGDLVIGTFGRGIYILDDLSPVRRIDEKALEADAILFPVKNPWLYVERLELGLPKQGFLGHSHFIAENPPFGAVFTVYLKESLESLKEKRQKAEKELREKKEPVFYPSWDALRAEDREEAPGLLLTVRDEDGAVVRRLPAPASEGVQRLAWDLRYPASAPINLARRANPDNPWSGGPEGPLVAPGRFSVSLERVIDGKAEPLGEAQTFEVVPLANASLPAQDRAAVEAFQNKVARLQRAAMGAAAVVDEAETRIAHLKQAWVDTPKATAKLAAGVREIEDRLADLKEALLGDGTVASRNEPTAPALLDRIFQVVGGAWSSTAATTTTHRQAYEIAARDFGPWLEKLRQLTEVDLESLEREAEAAGAPWTPGRFPTWKAE
jgi:photosystem II stability/assembly factor-like uncharacterized protein